MATPRALYAIFCIALVGGAQCAAAARVMPHQMPEVKSIDRSLLGSTGTPADLTPISSGAAVGLLTTLGLLLTPVVDVGAGQQLGDALDLTALSNFLKSLLVSILPELEPTLDSLLGGSGTNLEDALSPTLQGGALDKLLVGLVDTIQLLGKLDSNPSGADVVAALQPLLDGVNNFVGTDNTVPGVAKILNLQDLTTALKLPIDGADLENVVDANKLNTLLAQLVAAVINGLEDALATIPSSDAGKGGAVSSALKLVGGLLDDNDAKLPSASSLKTQLKAVKKSLKKAGITAKAKVNN